MELLAGEYYLINNSRILYWNGDCWMKPVKDSRGNYGFLTKLDKQPTKIKSVEWIKDINSYAKK